VGRNGSGVEVRAASIRLKFVLAGKTERETLRLNGKPLPPTPANVAYARRLAADVRRAIDNGAFAWADFFPGSARAAAAPATRTFGVAATDWLASKGRMPAATRGQYTNAAALWKRLLGADEPIDAFTYQRLASVVGRHPWASAKSANNYLIALRGIFGFEFAGPRAAKNPMVGVKNLRVVRKLPDPLTAAERDLILADLERHYDPRVAAYYRFAFHTGMRPEEIIALRWPDIDWRAGFVRVQRVRTFRGSERDGSKTHTERDVDLMPEAIAALNAMRPYTSMLKGADGEPGAADVFQNPVTGRPWHDERSQRDHYWKPALRRQGIRARRSYVTRHTFATIALMGGVQPAYIAQQLGNDLKTLLDRYARWIRGADGGTERQRLAGAMRGEKSPDRPQATEPENENAGKSLSSNNLPASGVGRRDWTRTKGSR
jgi:integrase